MIRTLRNSGIGQLFLGALVVSIILAFALTGAQPAAESAGDECAVEVGKICVEPREYNAAFRLMTSIGLNDSAVKRLNLREQIGRGLAEREVLVDEAKRLGIQTSEKDIDAELKEGRTRVSLPADGAERLAASLAMCVDGPSGCAPGTIGLRAINVKQGGSFDLELYKRTIRVVTGRSPVQFKAMQQKEYSAERLRELVRSQVRVSPDEAFLAYSRARSKATARTVDIKTSWFQRYGKAASEEEIAAWVTANKAEIDKAVTDTKDKWAVGCPVVSELRLNNADPNSDKAAEVKQKAESLRSRAKTSKDFGELARAESEGDTAPLGGRIGCLDSGYGAGAAVLVDAAAELKKEGDLSSVVESIRGFHILKLIDRVTEENKEKLVRDYVTYKLASTALSKKAAENFARELIKRASAGEPLADATTALLSLTLADGPWSDEDSEARKAENAPKSDISRAITIEQNPLPDAAPEASPSVVLFDLKKDDDVAQEPIATREGFAVLQLKSKEMITREKFDEERVDIMSSLRKRKAEQALKAYVDDLLKKAGTVTLNPKFIPPKGEDEPKEKDS